MKNYTKKQVQLMFPWGIITDMDGVSISDADKANGSPKNGDMIAVSPSNKDDRWLVARSPPRTPCNYQ